MTIASQLKGIVAIEILVELGRPMARNLGRDPRLLQPLPRTKFGAS